MAFLNVESFKKLLKANNTKLSATMDAKVAEIKVWQVKKVSALPELEAAEEKVLYLVPKEAGEENNMCVEYIFTEGAFEKIGDTAVTLVDYYTKEEIDAALEAKADASALEAYATTEAMTQAIESAVTEAAYELPTASTETLGGVKVDGTTVTVSPEGVISAAQQEVDLSDYAKTAEVTQAIEDAAYELPTASTDALGGVKVDGTTVTIDESGVISAAAAYELPTASADTLGGVKVDGTTVTVTEDGTITAAIPEEKELSDEEVTAAIDDIWG